MFKHQITPIIFMFLASQFCYAENNCDKAQIQPWRFSLKKQQVTFDDVISAIPKNWQPLVQTLNGLPLTTSEADLIKTVSFPPDQVTRVVSYTSDIRWKLPKENPVLFINIFLYKGCISSILLTDMAHPLNIYERETRTENGS